MKISVRIDDVNPLIQYTGDWRAGTQSTDSFFSSYSDGGTFTLTQSNDATATVRFNGTGVTVFGSKRGNHNLFTTTLDGDVRTGNGQDTQAETFNQTLFASSVLSNADHTLVIRDASTNTDPGQSYFDIDYLIIDTEVSGTKSVQLEDTDASWSYGPDASAWSNPPPQLPSFSQSTGHSTSSAQATATLKFTGSAVDLYGLVCSTCGEYWVSVDGATPVTLNAYNNAWTKPQTLMYMARNLVEGPHTITLTNLAATNGNMLNVDYAVVYGNSPAGGSGSGSTSASGANSSAGAGAGTAENQAGATSTSSNTPVGAIVGGVLGGLLILVVGLALILFCLRRKRKTEGTQPMHPNMLAHPYTPSVVGSGAYPAQFHVPPSGPQGYGSASGYAPSTYSGAGGAYGGAGAGYGGAVSPYAYQNFNPSQPSMFVPVGPPSHHGSASLPYLQSEVSGPSDGMGRRLSSIGSASGDTPPDYNAATLNGAGVPPMPLRRKN